MPTMEEVVGGYIKLRDKKKLLEDAHKQNVAPINEKMKMLEAWLLRELQRQGADHVGTGLGTVYQSTIVKPVIRDWSSVLDFIVANEQWGMLERRVSKTAVEEFMESTGTVPPGVEITRETFARIRK